MDWRYFLDFDYVIAPTLILLIGVLIIWLSIRRLLSLSSTVSSKWRRAAERTILSAVVLVAITVAGSSSF
jgi:hypothetical protein